MGRGCLDTGLLYAAHPAQPWFSGTRCGDDAANCPACNAGSAPPPTAATTVLVALVEDADGTRSRTRRTDGA